jgi:hypothetical protein
MAPPTSNTTYSPGPKPGTVIDSMGQCLTVPSDWQLLQPGDAALTRRVKLAGPHWLVTEKRGRRTFSKGLYAPAETIATLRSALDAERSTESYAKRRASDSKRRDAQQTAYVEDFEAAVFQFLNFHPSHETLGRTLASAVSIHATPVGSGTVARTKRIPIEQRAASAVIAWMRHQTTAYDSMVIPREKGKRREVRRMLAARSRQLLESYRSGAKPDKQCPLRRALNNGAD